MLTSCCHFLKFQDTHVSTNQIEVIIFWVSLFFMVVAWVGLAIVAIIKINLDWIVIDFIAAALTVVNIIGYLKCARG